MKRNIKMLVAALIVMLILSGAYFVAVKWPPKDEKPHDDYTQSDIEYLIKEDIDNIKSVEFCNGAIVYTINNSEEYSLEGYSSSILDKSKLSSAVNAAASVAISRRVDNKNAQIEEFGLENNNKYVCVKTKDGSEKKLIIGSATNIDGEYYARLSDSDKVCVISSYTAEALLKNPSEYRSTDICTMDSTSIEKVVIEKGKQKELDVEYDKDFVPISNQQPVSYLVKYPYNGVVASLDKLKTLFESIGSLTANSIVEENPSDLKKYGLDNPYIITVKDKDGSVTVKMGSYADENSVYVMCNNIPVVYTAVCPFYEIVKNAKADEYVERFVHIFVIDDVKSIVINKNGIEHKMSINNKTGKKAEYKIDERRTTEDRFKEIYQLVIGITASQFVNDTPKGDEKCSITFNFKDNTSKKFTYYLYNERSYIVKADNGMNCIVQAKTVDEMLDTFK